MLARRGIFISFEGGDGAGKSTQIALLGAYLENKNAPFVLTREPGGTPQAEALRNLLVTGDKDRWNGYEECLLNFAARSHHVRQVIKPALKGGQWVLCDRFTDSTVAYQGGGDPTLMGLINRLDEDLNCTPDITFILDIPEDEGLVRKLDSLIYNEKNEIEMRFEMKGARYHERVRAVYRKLAQKFPDRCVLVNGTKPIEEIHKQIIATIEERYVESPRL